MPVRFVALVFAVLAGLGALYWAQGQAEPMTVSGVIEADEIRVGSRVGGRVKRVLVEEGDTVAAGEALIELEPFDWYEQLAEAESQLAAAEANYAKLAAGFRAEEIAAAAAKSDQAQASLAEAVAGPRPQEIQEARDALALAKAELELAESSFKRTESLYGEKSVAREKYDKAASELKVARATAAVRQSQLDMLLEGTRKEKIDYAKASLAQAQAEHALRQHGYRPQEVAEASAQRDAAKASVETIKRRIAELTIFSPCESVVEAVDLRPGDLISTNAPVVSLMDTNRMWLRAYVPERVLSLVPLGRELPVHIDGITERTFSGKVTFVAREGEFTPSNAQTPEERGKQVFRIKVQIERDLELLRPGMAGDIVLTPEG